VKSVKDRYGIELNGVMFKGIVDCIADVLEVPPGVKFYDGKPQYSRRAELQEDVRLQGGKVKLFGYKLSGQEEGTACDIAMKLQKIAMKAQTGQRKNTIIVLFAGDKDFHEGVHKCSKQGLRVVVVGFSHNIADEYRTRWRVETIELDRPQYCQKWLKNFGRVLPTDTTPVLRALGLRSLFENEITTRSLYRSDEHGTSFDNMVEHVGDQEKLLVVIYKDSYVFGAYIEGGLQLPQEDLTKSHEYETFVRLFSLNGHFMKPKPIRCRKGVRVGGADEKLGVGESLWLATDGTDIRRCHQYTPKRYVPKECMGKIDEDGDAILGGELDFMADRVEVLCLV